MQWVASKTSCAYILHMVHETLTSKIKCTTKNISIYKKTEGIKREIYVGMCFAIYPEGLRYRLNAIKLS